MIAKDLKTWRFLKIITKVSCFFSIVFNIVHSSSAMWNVFKVLQIVKLFCEVNKQHTYCESQSSVSYCVYLCQPTLFIIKTHIQVVLQLHPPDLTSFSLYITFFFVPYAHVAYCNAPVQSICIENIVTFFSGVTVIYERKPSKFWTVAFVDLRYFVQKFRKALIFI